MADRLLIHGARVLDPANGIDLTGGTVFVEDDRIAAVGKDIEAGNARVWDARGLVLTPGFVDLHTHLREPGLEYEETVETGTRAAACGGFTTLCCMPNTEPALDSRAAVEFVLSQAVTGGTVRVLPIGCVTKGRVGKALAEMGELAETGCVAFSDDGSPVADASIMRRALEYAGGLGIPVIDHCETPAMAGGVMHEGWVSTRLGLEGIPSASEDSMIARDLTLAKQTGAHVHIAHISTAGGVDLVRKAKADGVPVTSEVTPHHLTLTHEAVMHREGHDMLAYETNAKMYPPLRAKRDVEACVTALRDGVIDAIATDHAPHAVEDKLREFDDALFGVTMLETALGLSLRAVADGSLAFERVIEALTVGAVRALGLDRNLPGLGSLTVGAPADITLIDRERAWTVQPETFASKGKNTPLGGRELRGQVVATIYAGKVVFELGDSSA